MFKKRKDKKSSSETKEVNLNLTRTLKEIGCVNSSLPPRHRQKRDDIVRPWYRLYRIQEFYL